MSISTAEFGKQFHMFTIHVKNNILVIRLGYICIVQNFEYFYHITMQSSIFQRGRPKGISRGMTSF